MDSENSFLHNRTQKIQYKLNRTLQKLILGNYFKRPNIKDIVPKCEVMIFWVSYPAYQ